MSHPEHPPNYDWRDALFARRGAGLKFGLEPIRAVYEALGCPCGSCRWVQVVGTNGKGSTASMLALGLQKSGRRVGLFTSPHLHRVGERVRINGEACADEDIRLACLEIERAEGVADASRALTFFEVLTLAALLIFERGGIEDAVMEAGLGGRLDSTSLRQADCILLSAVGMDHQAFLGERLEDIAAEKLAVLHPRASFALGVQPHALVREMAESRARELGISIHHASRAAWSPLEGAHQRDNAGLALAGLGLLGVELEAKDLEGLSWPGRLERVKVDAGELVFDVGHNPLALRALEGHLERDPERPSLAIFGAMADKSPEQTWSALRDRVDRLWLVPPSGERAWRPSSAELPTGTRERRFTGPEDPELLDQLRSELGRGSTVLVCGSHFVVGPLRAWALGISPLHIDPPELTDPLHTRRKAAQKD